MPRAIEYQRPRRRAKPDLPVYWKHDLLTQSEERALAMRAKAGDKSARDELVLKNQRLVVSLARRCRNGCPLPLEDLVSAGNRGLLHAIDLYDPDKGRLTTYANRWIRQTIRREIQDTGYLVRVSAWVIDIADQYIRLSRQMEMATGCEPSFDDVCDRLDVDANQRECLRSAIAIYSLEFKPITAVDLYAPAYEDEDTDEARRYHVGRLLNRIKERDASALRAYYGIGSPTGEGLSLVQLAANQGRSYQCIQQVVRRGLRSLRQIAGEELRQIG